MFLATTALTEFWDTSEELLFLGPWCLRQDRRREWEGLTSRVMSSPWSDRRRFDNAVAYLDGCQERMLRALADYLNGVHGVAYGTRYWRILIGPWLIHFLHGLYDRYVHLREALEVSPGLRTTVLDPRSFRVPHDALLCAIWLSDDPYNLQLFSQLLHQMGYAFPARRLDSRWPDPWEQPASPWWRRAGGAGRRWGVGLAEKAASRLWNGRWRAALCDMHCSTSQLWALSWRSRLRASPKQVTWDVSFATHQPVFDERRNGLATLPSDDAFERLCVRLLPQHVPTLYVEGYHDARDAMVRRLGAVPAVIMSALGWHFRESFKFLAAEASAGGRRLVAVQHGGGYGIYRHSPLERHERVVSDTFLAWGWANGASDRLRNVPSPTLSSLVPVRRVERRHHRPETILFVSTAHLRYLLRFHSSPIGIHTPAYLQWQLRFLTAIPDRLRRVVRFRPHPEEGGEAVRDQVTSRVGPLQLDGHRPFAETLDDARLVVVDHSSTTFLEALHWGGPTVLFWDPSLSEVRGEAEPFVEALRVAGILWDSPEAAAAHVAAVYDTPWEWWGREEVQEARQRFVERYALGRRDWVACWAKVLDDELAHARTESHAG